MLTNSYFRNVVFLDYLVESQSQDHDQAKRTPTSQR